MPNDKPEDKNMKEATEITEEIQSVIGDGLFPFQQVRLLVWESMQKAYHQGHKDGFIEGFHK